MLLVDGGMMIGVVDVGVDGWRLDDHGWVWNDELGWSCLRWDEMMMVRLSNID